jgi:PHD-finger
MWVVSDRDGTKRLVSEMVPGARHWRIGDPNVNFCFVCTDGEDLLGCHTCKRSYHRLCLSPPPPHDIDHETFHCPTCTARGWHMTPPTDILPYQSLSEIHSEPGNIHDGLHTTSPTSGSLKQLGSSHHARTQAYIQGTVAPTRNAAKSSVVPGEASAASHGKGATKPGKRRSRYQTVSDEVDSAMSTIYRELESASELRTEIARLHDKVARLEQERQIQEGKVALVREDVHAQTNAELTWLRDEVAKLRNAHVSLSTENEQLRVQVQEAKSELDSKLKETDEMKTKLREWLSK